VAEQSLSANRRRVSIVALVTALVGSVLLALTIRRVGWADVASGIASVGWAFLLVVVLGAARMGVRARAWMLCAEEPGAASRLRFADAFGALLSADALGNLTPLGLLASEPIKIILARSRVSTVTSVVSVATENAFYVASVLVVLLTGTWLFLQRTNVPTALQQVGAGIVVLALAAGLIMLWAARTQPAVLSALAPWMTRIAGRGRVPTEALRDVEARLYGVFRWPLGRIALVAGWEVLFHLVAVIEVWLVLRLLPGGDRTTLADAFLMESTGRFVSVAFKFIPYRLGVDEAGSGAVAQVLGFTAATGVTLALVRRLRILVLNAAGLVLLARSR
jgi:hypothetical protein